MKLKIAYPIKEAKPGNVPLDEGGYALVILDANEVSHYFNQDGTYDGYSSDPCVDGETGICLN